MQDEAELFLGLDAGGTQMRWALVNAAGVLQHEGQSQPIAGAQMASEAGRAAMLQTLQALAADLSTQQSAPRSAPRSAQQPVLPRAALAGVTGLADADAPALALLMQQALQLAPGAARAMSDIRLSCAAAFEPGQGIVLIAGTGSVAAHVDAQGQLHRSGGRGAIIDDAGGGHWIARQALQQIWRAEDARPGSWRESPLAQRLFKRIGGSDWADTRAWVYGASRGELGTLAQAVAEAADEDPAAAALLRQAGQELARLVRALQQRLEPAAINAGFPAAAPAATLAATPAVEFAVDSWQSLSLAFAGRVFDLHPLVETGLRSALPSGQLLQRLRTPAQHAAARLAARLVTDLGGAEGVLPPAPAADCPT